ncbi:MAG: methyltransferase [Calditrichaceae bacterium]
MFQAAKTLRDFGILSYLSRNSHGAALEDIAEQNGISAYGAMVLLEAGLSLDLVMVKDDKYFLSKVGYFINDDPMIRISMDFSGNVNYKGAFYLDESVKQEKPLGLLKEFGDHNTVYEALSALPGKFRESWFGFNKYFSNAAFDEALPVLFKNDPKKILDMGGNTGRFAVKCCEHAENVRVAILDLPGQIKDAEEYINAKGMQDRIDIIPINFLDFSQPYPAGFDVIWMSQFLDCFSDKEARHILRKTVEIMDDDVELYIMEPLWDKQKADASVYSLHAVSLYFTFMANGNSRIYHSDDLMKLIRSVGLKIIDWYDQIGISHSIIKCKKGF